MQPLGLELGQLSWAGLGTWTGPSWAGWHVGGSDPLCPGTGTSLEIRAQRSLGRW